MREVFDFFFQCFNLKRYESHSKVNHFMTIQFFIRISTACTVFVNLTICNCAISQDQFYQKARKPGNFPYLTYIPCTCTLLVLYQKQVPIMQIADHTAKALCCLGNSQMFIILCINFMFLWWSNQILVIYFTIEARQLTTCKQRPPVNEDTKTTCK